MKRLLPLVVLFTVMLGACEGPTRLKTYPKIKVRNVGGKEVLDTVLLSMPQFSLVNQDNKPMSDKQLAGKITTTDFFFTSCQTICPKIKQNMLRLQEAFKDNDQVQFASISVDPVNDTPEVINKYAKALGANTEQWHFLTGNKDSIFSIANKFLLIAQYTKSGEIDHSDMIVLTDKKGVVRGYYKGTVPNHIEVLIADIKRLLDEK